MLTSQVESAHGFRPFDLSSVLERNLDRAGYHVPRPIQIQTIPAVLDGRDILGLAQTGTGKTAAFALPILEKLLPGRRGPRVLVLAPTRELALQIDDEFRKLAASTRIRTVVIYGGVSDRPQIQKLRRHPDVIVACPGRLLDLFRRGEVHLDRIETLVLDEADHMFDMGFLPDIRRILAMLPVKRQNLLFGATMPAEVRHLAERILEDPHVAECAHSAPAPTVDHALFPVLENRKLAMLEHLLSLEDFVSAIVFTRTKHRAKRLANQLCRSGHQAVDLQGNRSQSQRDRAMTGFRAGRFDILVATDIVARGIDVYRVSHVINFDVPQTAEAYTHRIGRTGRSERAGRAFTFVTDADRSVVHAIQTKIGSPIRIERVVGFEEAFVPTRTGQKRSTLKGRGQEPRRASRRRRRTSDDDTEPARRRNGAPDADSRGPRGSKRRSSTDSRRGRPGRRHRRS